jgi:SAM-dependent methyltransferase
LDLACGAGRNAIFLAAQGWNVTAVDSSNEGLKLAGQRALDRGVEIDFILADLEKREFRIEPDDYSLICDCFYLQRDLFPSIREGISPGGIFVAEIHLEDKSPNLKPMNPAFLLRRGELLSEFTGWKIEHYDEAGADGPEQNRRKTARLIARRR